MTSNWISAQAMIFHIRDSSQSRLEESTLSLRVSFAADVCFATPPRLRCTV
jgi:hypothetical protein